MAKTQKQDGGGWHFPAALEIIKCKEGNKEFIKERPNRGGGRLVLICEYHIAAVDEFGGDDARIVWRLAKPSAEHGRAFAGRTRTGFEGGIDDGRHGASHVAKGDCRPYAGLIERSYSNEN